MLLDKLPYGESKAEKLETQLKELCKFCEETLATSLRMEHTAILDKTSSIRAALKTW